MHTKNLPIFPQNRANRLSLWLPRDPSSVSRLLCPRRPPLHNLHPRSRPWPHPLSPHLGNPWAPLRLSRLHAHLCALRYGLRPCPEFPSVGGVEVLRRHVWEPAVSGWRWKCCRFEHAKYEGHDDFLYFHDGVHWANNWVSGSQIWQSKVVC